MNILSDAPRHTIPPQKQGGSSPPNKTPRDSSTSSATPSPVPVEPSEGPLQVLDLGSRVAQSLTGVLHLLLEALRPLCESGLPRSVRLGSSMVSLGGPAGPQRSLRLMASLWSLLVVPNLRTQGYGSVLKINHQINVKGASHQLQ